ncbi:MAG: mechanosensitive ion channel family protein [Bacteroidota bacterium]
MKRQNRVFFTLLFTFLWTFNVYAQNNQDEVPITLESPYNTMLVHLHYLQPETYQPALAARVFENIPDSVRAMRLAIQLKQIYDGEGLFVYLNKIPTDSAYVDSLAFRSVFTPFPSELPDIYLERIGARWYYAERSIQVIPTIHKRVYPFGTDKILNLIPQFGQQVILGLMLWQWLGLLIALLLACFGYLILARLLNPIVGRISRSRLYPSLVPKKMVRSIARLISVLLIIRLVRAFIPLLQMPVEINSLVINALKLASIFVFVVIALRIIDVIMAYVSKFTKTTESKMDEQLVPILTRAAQSVVIVLAIISALRLFNVNVTALIAGISIGGLALALAAQDTLKNLFGSLTIFMDKPFQIGDWVNFGGVDGTVEEVGFRSTRVRTFANSLVYVPNGKLADMVINNYGLRIYRRYKSTISITYDTPPVLIDAFIAGLKEIVAQHPGTRKDYYEVHLNEMSATSLDILFYIFFTVGEWGDELKAKHQILMAILQLADELGVRFAFPTSTVHIEEFPGKGVSSPKYNTDPEVAAEAVEQFLEKYKKGLSKGTA